MSIIGSNILAGASGQAGGGGAYEISRSVRFSSSDSAFLSRTPGTAGNRKTWTWAGWVKLCAVPGTYTVLFGAGAGGSDSGLIRLNYESSGKLNLAAWNTDPIIRTASVYRDFSAWYHIVVAVDTANATASNRAKIYINGTEAAYDSDFRSSISNLDTPWNNNVFHAIGRLTSSDGQYANAYFADVYNIDGQALGPTSFGEFDTNGVWQPIAYTGSYGTNGFRLPFSDNSTAAALGTDTSSNGNDWTVNNIAAGDGTVYSLYLSSPNGAYSGSSKANAFDGSIATNFEAGNPIGGFSTIRFEPAISINVSSQLRIYAFNYTAAGTVLYQYRVNDGSWVDLPTDPSPVSEWFDLSFTGTLSSFEYRSNTNITYKPSLFAVEIDGSILVDGAGAGNDSLVDSPVNGSQVDTGVGGEVVGNYATLNPLGLSHCKYPCPYKRQFRAEVFGGSSTGLR
jgi:hypothetical protein